ncbi:MAG: DUF2207 domain-containing protein [Arenimonas sp.]
MSRCVAIALALAGALAMATSAPARADERILNYESRVQIVADGSLDVTEKITVHAEGVNIRRGIYRDFPTRYKDRYGNRVVVDFELLGVERDNHPESSFIERKPNGVRINTGGDSFLPVPSDITYTIHYKTNRQLGFFPDHDELYWNVTGLGWAFPIDHILSTVQLPVPLPVDQMKLEAYTGPEGAKGQDYQAKVEPGVAMFRNSRPFAVGEGLTVVVSFPKGQVAEPTGAQRLRWFLRDNRGVLVGLAGLVLLAMFYLWRWLRVGRDPDAGPIFPRYDAPANFGPGELRMLRKMGGDRLCFTADVVDMGVHGFLRIHGGSEAGGWRLEKIQGSHLDSLTASQRVLAAQLFKEDNEIELEVAQQPRLSAALTAHAAELTQRMQPRYFNANGGNIGLGLLFSILVAIAAFWISGGSGVALLIVIVFLMLGLHITFAFLLKAPTLEGRKLLDEIEGLGLYLGVAERDELQSVPAPDSPPMLDAKRYETLLPYAIALEVAEAWTKKFTAAVGAAAAQQATSSWYNSASGQSSLMSMGSSLGSALNSQISSASTPPGSSSGGGGGGSSGGGGGGGGGGGR